MTKLLTISLHNINTEQIYFTKIAGSYWCSELEHK